MTNRANSTFVIKSWNEEPYDEPAAGPKLTRASVVKSYEGDIQGKSTLEYLMMHREESSAVFVGLERLVGTFKGRSGSFVLQHEGTFSEGVARADYFVLPGSGTDELRGLCGKGKFEAGHQENYTFVLEYKF